MSEDIKLDPSYLNDPVLRASIFETLEVYRRQINLHAEEINSLKEVKYLKDIIRILKNKSLNLIQFQTILSNKAQSIKEEPKTLTKLAQVFTTSPWCYGLTQFVRSKILFFQIVWFLAVIFSVSIATVFISNTINDYLSYKVITQAKITQNDSIIMPQITVCQHANLSETAYEIKYCWFEGSDCSNDYMYVDLFLKNGEKSKCLRFNGGRNSSGRLF